MYANFVREGCFIILMVAVAIHRISALMILAHKGACNVTTDEGRIDITSLGNTDGTARFVS